MKKAIYPTLLIFTLLCSCAKVTEEAVPCIGTPPPAIQMTDQAVQIGSQINLVAVPTSPNGTVRWTGPNNFVSTQRSLNVYIADTTCYGTYTITQFVYGCPGPTTTFQITGNSPAPCTISSSDYNIIRTADGSVFQFTYSASILTQNCNGSVYDISAVSNLGYTFDIYMHDAPVAGATYSLVSSCSALSKSNQAYVILNAGGQPGFYPISGNAYCNIILGKAYITFCGAIFKNTYTSLNTTVNGNIQFQ